MKMDSRFASRATTVDDTPEPFREELTAHLGPEEEPSLIICAPAGVALRHRTPATVLAVTDQRWLIVMETRPGVMRVESASFEETLLIEFTEILLYGEMRLHFALEGEAHSSAAYFNTVMDRFYREATLLVLNGIEGARQGPNEEPSTETSVLSALPFKFRNAVTEHVPPGRNLLCAMHWPTVIGGFRRELGPAAALTVTDRELIVITEDRRRRWFESKQGPKHACIATYLPLGRLAEHRISPHSKFCLLELETRAHSGGETVEIMFPLGYEEKVRECMERVAMAMNGTPEHMTVAAHSAREVSLGQ
jgi:hypothetical protein